MWPESFPAGIPCGNQGKTLEQSVSKVVEGSPLNRKGSGGLQGTRELRIGTGSSALSGPGQ